MSVRLPATIRATKTLPADFEPLLTIDQVSLYLNYSKRSIERMVSEGMLPVVSFGTTSRRNVRFKRSEIDKWVIARSTPGRRTRMPVKLTAAIPPDSGAPVMAAAQ